MLALLGLAELLGMTPWFSASAVASGIVSEYHLTAAQAAWLTMAVQGGFVAGTLVSALLNLSDLLSPRWVFGAGCLGAALANALVTAAPSPVEAVAWRFATGTALALVYPPGMKIAAGWFKERRGIALGILVGSLTLGKALPYLLAAVSGGSWRSMMLLSSCLAGAGGLLVVLMVRDGPYVVTSAPFDPRAAVRIFTQRGTRLGVLGYLGHMWELYAMWTWVGAYVAASLAAQGTGQAERWGSLAAFFAIGAGAAGCVVAGFYADRVGRARVAAWAMMTSATCCALTVPAFHAPYAVVVALVAVWGFAVVADSAQFSVIVSETAPDNYVGTALTVQTCLGFLLTMVSIRLTSAMAAWLGWQWAFVLMLPGPVLGVQAMVALMKPRVRVE
ncbi:MAG: MFS transporter [Acidobacteria bacterium]|nr:MFS transporter [Acidobacteriota bacterium]